MKIYIRFFRLLMIFLLLWFAVPVDGVYAQWMSVKNTPSLDKFLETLDNGVSGEAGTQIVLYDETADAFNQDFGPGDEMPLYLSSLTEADIAAKKEMLSVQENQNYIRLIMHGDNNTATATQEGGKGNVMDLGIYGNNNEGLYLQQGKDNYIFDRIGTQGSPVNGVHHEIKQFGEGHAIENRGMQTIPLIINQQGEGMRMQIKGRPTSHR